MAKITKSNISLSADSGSGDATIKVSAAENTGRNSRSATFTISGTGVASKNVTVTQNGAALFVVVNDGSITAAGGVVTISGSTNAKSLTLVNNGGSSIATLKVRDDGKHYTYSGGGANFEEAIPNDPGATAAFDFSIQFNVASGESTSDAVQNFKLIADDGSNRVEKYFKITRSAAAAFLKVQKSASDATAVTAITLDASGSEQSFFIDSNTSWSIS